MMADFAARHRHWILVKVVSLKKLSLRAEEWNLTLLNKADGLVRFHPWIASNLQTEPSVYEGAWAVCCF